MGIVRRALLFAGLVVGCSPPVEFPVGVRLAGDNPADAAAVVDAFAAWERATAGRARARVESWSPPRPFDYERDFADRPEDGTLRVYVLREREPGLLKLVHEFGNDDVRGVTRGKTIVLRWSKLPDPTDTYGTALHEIGHVYGLGHSETRGELMHPNDNAECIDAAALRAFCDLYGCPDAAASMCGGAE